MEIFITHYLVCLLSANVKCLNFQSWPICLNRGKWGALGFCIKLREIAKANVCDFKPLIKNPD